MFSLDGLLQHPSEKKQSTCRRSHHRVHADKDSSLGSHPTTMVGLNVVVGRQGNGFLGSKWTSC